MGIRGTAAFAALALVFVAAAVWWLTSSPGPLPMAGSGPEAAARTAAESAAVDAKGSAVAPASEAVTRRASELPGEVSPPLDAAELAMFRGRVVDAAGEPLAGATARLHAWSGNSQRMDAHRARHGEVDWTNPEPVVTGPDGRFEFTFVPPPPFQFALDVSAPEVVSVTGRWGVIEPGTIKDFGDIVLTRGARVTGQLVDADGRPVALPQGERVTLSLNRYNRSDRPRGELTPRDAVNTDLRPDGSFTSESPADPGTWNVSIRGLLLNDRSQEVAIAAPATEIAVVVMRPESLLRVSGTVVDDAGQPVGGAGINPVGIPRASNWILSTKRDGSFEVEQRPNAVDPGATFALTFEEPGYRRTTVEAVSWGQTELRIVMPRIPAMDVLVVRAADGTPVEDYGLRVMNAAGIRSSVEHDVIGGWTHPGGLTRVTSMKDGGEKRIFVEPREGTGLAPVLQRVDVDVSAPPRLTISLPAAVEQRLRLVHADGRPAAGSRVELVGNFGEPVPPGALVLAFGSGSWSTAFHGIRIAAAETDADGRCTLAGPPDVPLTIRCFGDHPPLVVDDLRLTAEVRELRLDAAGTVTVRVDPPEVLAAWRRASGLPEDEPLDPSQMQRLPRVKLWRMGATGDGESFPPGITAELVPFDADGIAVLRGAPTGSWQVQCYWNAANQQFYMVAPDPLEVVAGADQDFVVDASTYRTGSVSGRLLVGGRPAADTRLTLQRTLDRTDPTVPAFEQRVLQTDADGSFGGDLPVGDWRVYAAVAVPSERVADQQVQVRALPDVVITAGAASVAELRAELLHTEARVVDAAGQPVAGLRFWIDRGDGLDQPWIGTTDAGGRTTLFGSAGSHLLSCRIRSLLDEARFRVARNAALAAHDGDWQAAMAALDAIVELPTPVPIPADGVVEIRLPAAWDR